MDGEKIIHFGVTLTLTRGYRLTRENYAVISNKNSHGKNEIYIHALRKNDEKLIRTYSKIYADEEGLIYRGDWCEEHLSDVMQNFDLNMRFFEKLNHVKFAKEVIQFLNKTNFFEISDLNEYSCPGYYVMILDKYCQIYIGTTKDIKKRIRQHWGGGKLKFDRLMCGSIAKSKISIDSFRALDTTRILVYPTDSLYDQENEFINWFSDEFICNRMCGGNIGEMEFGVLSAMANIKTRDLE